MVEVCSLEAAASEGKRHSPDHGIHILREHGLVEALAINHALSQQAIHHLSTGDFLVEKCCCYAS